MNYKFFLLFLFSPLMSMNSPYKSIKEKKRDKSQVILEVYQDDQKCSELDTGFIESISDLAKAIKKLEIEANSLKDNNFKTKQSHITIIDESNDPKSKLLEYKMKIKKYKKQLEEYETLVEGQQLILNHCFKMLSQK